VEFLGSTVLWPYIQSVVDMDCLLVLLLCRAGMCMSGRYVYVGSVGVCRAGMYIPARHSNSVETCGGSVI
jgi:hypothetical protein